jgi:hypothetical protein
MMPFECNSNNPRTIEIIVLFIDVGFSDFFAIAVAKEPPTMFSIVIASESPGLDGMNTS